MSKVATILSQHEILTLFCVIAVGLGLSRLEVRGVKLGILGVLFAGLGLATWAKLFASELQVATDLRELGLVLFVYCVGLSSGAGFFSAFRERGLRLNLVVLGGLVSGAGIALLGGTLFELPRGVISGIFCGALSNTPALGAATDVLRGSGEAVDPVLGYSLTYPLGVVGELIAFRAFFQDFRSSIRRSRYRADRLRFDPPPPSSLHC